MSNTRTKIIFLTIDYWPNNYGGMGIHLYNISHILSKWYDITVCFMNLDLEDNTTQYKRYKDNEIEIIEFPVTYKQICEKYNDSVDTKRYMLSLATGYLISEKIEKLIDLKNEKVIIHSHCEAFNFTCDYLKFKYDVPVVNTIHYKSWDSLKNIQCAWINSMFDKSDKCIFVSNWLESELEKYSTQCIEKSVVIHNGVTQSMLPFKKNQYKKELKICCVGTLKKRKGFDRLILAVANMKNKDCVKITIIGCGEEKENLLSLAEANKVHVRFTGFLDYELTRKEIYDSNVVAVPSREEAFGLVVLEAMAEGKCLVAAKTGGIIELVENKENGYLVNTQSEMTDILDYLYDNPYELAKISWNAYTEAEKYDWKYIAEKTRKVYREIEKDCFLADKAV